MHEKNKDPIRNTYCPPPCKILLKKHTSKAFQPRFEILLIHPRSLLASTTTPMALVCKKGGFRQVGMKLLFDKHGDMICSSLDHQDISTANILP